LTDGRQVRREEHVVAKPQTVTLAFEKRTLKAEEAPVCCNYADFARVATDTIMEIGFFDLVEFANRLEAHDPNSTVPIPTQVFITHRFQVSPHALKMMRDGLEKILDALKQATPMDVSQ